MHFVVGFQKEFLESIDDQEYVYLLGIVALSDGTRKSVKRTEQALGNK